MADWPKGGDGLHRAGRAVKRADPLLFGAGATVAVDQFILPADPSVLGASFALTGPSPALAPGHVPVRGDLAHIAMAGKWFVPHYAVPMPHVVRAGGAALLKAANGAEVLEQLAAGVLFDVLEVSGGWCWGQAGEGGFVGYVAADLLEPVTA